MWVKASLNKEFFRKYLCFDERKSCIDYNILDISTDNYNFYSDVYKVQEGKCISMGEFPAYFLIKSKYINHETELFLENIINTAERGSLICNFEINTLEFVQKKLIYFEEVCILSVGLNEPLATIKSKFRSSYKSLINKAARETSVKYYFGEKVASKLRTKLRTMHLKSAGKRTRSYFKWCAQFEQIENRQAILICICKDQQIINYSIFSIVGRIAYYQTGVNDLGFGVNYGSHFAVYKAISILKEMSLCGLIMSQHNLNGLSDKEKNIVYFKSGMARIEERYTKICW